VRPHLEREIDALRGRGVIAAPRAALLLRIVRRDLVSIRAELQATLYAGVLLVVAGVGLLFKEHFRHLGPAVISVAVALAAAGCLWHVGRTAPPFSRDRVPSPAASFDYLLLLGVLLLAADLAYVEVQFRPLGQQWPWHLLLVGLAQLALAYRYDARPVLSLGLASLAAWRGVAVSFPFRQVLGGSTELVRVNALCCGALFLAAGAAGKARGWKAHFEPVYGNLGLALVLGAGLSGIFAGDGARGALWWVALLAAAAAAIVLGYRARRVDFFAQGTVAAYIAFLRGMVEVRIPAGGLYFIALSSLAVIGLILWAHRHMKDEP
jgi:hypothetical protein